MRALDSLKLDGPPLVESLRKNLKSIELHMFLGAQNNDEELSDEAKAAFFDVLRYAHEALQLTEDLGQRIDFVVKESEAAHG